MKYHHKIAALCISRIFDIENRKFVMQLSEKLREQDCMLWIYHINTDLYWNEEVFRPEEAVFDLVDFETADVIIIMDEKIKSRRVTEKLISGAKAHHVPVIIVDGNDPGCSCVNFDYRSGFEQIVRHVLEEHHVQNPHFMGGIAGNPFSDERLEVFRQVIEEYGIPFREDRVSYGMFWARPAIEATEKLIAGENLPDAILCANDIMAINVSNTLQKHGISVPEQVIVTGFDGIEEIYFASPNLTSVRCGCSDLSESVFQTVMHCLANPDYIENVSVRPFLLKSSSCGCSCTENGRQLFNFNDRFYRYQDDRQILYEITEKMQSCDTIAEAGYCLFCDQLHDMTFLINPWCEDHTVNHFESRKETSFEETMLLFFETERFNFQQKKISRKEVIPDLEQYMNRGYPLIFNAVGFMGIPLGYLCFHFPDYELVNYCKIPQIINILGAGLGGFINWQYQRYLMQQLEFIYKYDALTGLLNRLCFNKEFDALKESLHGEECPMEVILSDLDGLKKINDNFGHNAGDHAIRTAAEALKQACPPGALCVRFGGDEMLAVIAGEYQVADIINSIHRWLAHYNQTSGLDYEISASVGGYTGTLSADTEFSQILQKADAAMYSRKQKKRAIHSESL